MSVTLSWTTNQKPGGRGRSGFNTLPVALAEGLRPEFLSAAIQPAAELVLATAQRLVPKRSDERLLRSLFCEEESADETGASWIIGCERAVAFYATMVEFGTAAHEQHGGKYVHRGAGAHPFLRPAMDTNQDAIMQIIGEGVAADLEAAAAGAAA